MGSASTTSVAREMTVSSLPSEEAGGESKQHTDHQGDASGQEGDRERGASAVRDPDELVAPRVVDARAGSPGAPPSIFSPVVGS